jgi:hypothetical protein
MDLIFLFFWLILFFWRKDNRKEMLFISTLLGVVSIILEPLCFQDWWHPLTITGTIPGIEDFLFGFVVGGIAAVIYEDFFKVGLKEKKRSKKKELINNLNLIGLFLLGLIIIFLSFFFLDINTFLSSSIIMLITIVVMYLKRPDLIQDSIFSGIMLTLLAFLVYTLVQIINPGWVESLWYFQNVPHIIIFNLPIDDILWYFLAGALLGPLYEFWKQAKLVKK